MEEAFDQNHSLKDEKDIVHSSKSTTFTNAYDHSLAKESIKQCEHYELKTAKIDNFNTSTNLNGFTQTLLQDGRSLRDCGEFDSAQLKFISALQIARKINHLELEVDALNLQASIFSLKGEDNLALDYLNQALDISQNQNLSEKTGNILTNMGKINLKLGDYSEALKNTKQAYSLYEQFAPHSQSAVYNLLDIGNIYRHIGDYNDAKYFYEKAYKLSIKNTDFRPVIATLNNLGIVAFHFRDYDIALDHFEHALKLCREKNHKQYEIASLDGIGQVYTAKGDFKKAIIVHQEALNVAKVIGEPESEAKELLSLGKDYFELAQYSSAIDELMKALNISQIYVYKKLIYEIHKLLSTIYQKQANFEKAYMHHCEFHEVEKEVFNEKSEETTRQLTVKFDLERAHFEAEQYRLSSEVAERAAQEAEKIVRIRTRELEESQLEVVMRLAQAAELRDEDTGEHTFRVGRNAAAIAYCLGWSEAEVKVIYLAARLHDVGKIGISDTILLKPGKLTDDEFELMRQHTVIGAKMLSNGQSALLRMAEKIALAHHERWDGNGYPNKIAGEAIPIAARIVSVADVLDALTHSRPYKKAWTVEETLAEIERNSGRQFDPNIVRIAVKIFSGENCISPVAKPSDWEQTFKELQDLFGLSRFSM